MKSGAKMCRTSIRGGSWPRFHSITIAIEGMAARGKSDLQNSGETTRLSTGHLQMRYGRAPALSLFGHGMFLCRIAIRLSGRPWGKMVALRISGTSVAPT
jgi:hypothetical protein